MMPVLGNHIADKCLQYGPITFAPDVIESPPIKKKMKKEQPASPSTKATIPVTPSMPNDAKPVKALTAEMNKSKRKSSADLGKKEEKKVKVESEVKSNGHSNAREFGNSYAIPDGPRNDRQPAVDPTASAKPKINGSHHSKPAPPTGMPSPRSPLPPSRPPEEVLFIKKKKVHSVF